MYELLGFFKWLMCMAHCRLQPFHLTWVLTFAISQTRPSTPDVLWHCDPIMLLRCSLYEIFFGLISISAPLESWICCPWIQFLPLDFLVLILSSSIFESEILVFSIQAYPILPKYPQQASSLSWSKKQSHRTISLLQLC